MLSKSTVEPLASFLDYDAAERIRFLTDKARSAMKTFVPSIFSTVSIQLIMLKSHLRGQS